MSAKYVQDMTNGNVISHLIKFSLPMLIGNVFQQLYNIIDAVFVGHFIGDEAFAAVGCTGSISFLFFSVVLGFASGIGIIISQYFGAKEDAQVKRSITNSIYVIGTVAIAMSLLAFLLAEPVLIFLKTPADLLPNASTFLKVLSAGMIAVASYNAIAFILRSLGDSKTPLYFLIASCLLNILLDILFIPVLKLGVAGAAIATVISQASAAFGCIIFAIQKNPYFKLQKSDFKVSWPIITKCIRIGVPVAIQNSVIAISLVSLQSVVNRFGETAMAAFAGISRIEQLIQQPFNSFGAAIATFAGQNIGANKIDRVKQGYHKSILIVAIFSFCALLAAQFGGHIMMQLFVKNPESIRLGAFGIRITSSMYFALGMIYITRGVLNGCGDSFYSMINGFIEVIGRVGFASLLVAIPFIGIWGVWGTTALTWFITAAASVIRYKQGKWKKKSIVH